MLLVAAVEAKKEVVLVMTERERVRGM